jgi:gamma-tubulin complex component 5
MKRHRSRYQRRQNRNVIGFSQSLRESQDSSEENSDLDESDESLRDIEPTFSMVASFASSAEEGFFSRVDKMSTELDGLVRFVRRGVESLSGKTGDAAPAFGVLAFALEDWDS